MMHSEYIQEYLCYWQQHDAAGAYRFLKEQFYQPALRFCCTWVKNEADAEEIVSDVLIRIWQKGDRLKKVKNLKVYVFTAVRNAALNFLRQKQNHQILSWEELDISLAPLVPDPAQLLISSEMLTRIQQAIDQLPPKCKLVFKLIREEGFRNKDVAEILHISVNTIDNHLATAVRKISEAIHLHTLENPTKQALPPINKKKSNKR